MAETKITADGHPPSSILLPELEFYSEAALAFAKEKSEQVEILQRQLTALRLKPFQDGAREDKP